MQLGRFPTIFQAEDPPRAGSIRVVLPPGFGSADELGGEPGELLIADVADGVAVTRVVSTLALPIAEAIPLLVAARSTPDADRATVFHSAVVAAALQMVARGRILPGVSPSGDAAWRAGPFDVADIERVRALAAAMPPAARAVPVDPSAEPLVLPDAEGVVRALFDAVADALPRTPAASWLTGDARYATVEPAAADADLQTWADEVAAGVDRGLRLALRLEVRGTDVTVATFRMVVRLRNLADPTRVIDAETLWAGGDAWFGSRATFDAMVAVRRAARVWPLLEELLADADPVGLDLVDADVIDLLDGAEARLAAAGIVVEWPVELSRGLESRVAVAVGEEQPADVAEFLRTAKPLPLRWELTLDGKPLTSDESGFLTAGRAVVTLRDRWVVVPPELARRAREPELPDLAAWDAFGAAVTGGVDVDGVREDAVAQGWLGRVVATVVDPDRGTEALGQPALLDAHLREYQQRGLRWLQRMTTLGLGACLADDMGLGKTIMVIALILRRTEHGIGGSTLVVCPTSLLGNWEREIGRFAPGVPVRRFHGSTRSLEDLPDGGVVLTTYGTLRADPGPLAARRWSLLVADEAQHVKNRLSGTARALRTVEADARIALSGTPVENNLAELWAVLDWCTPGLLGRIGTFRTRWSRPIEVDRDGGVAERLGVLVRPFVLRRLKSDPGIAPELPPKTETDHLISLTPEQVGLYEQVVREVMAEVSGSSTAIARRGLVLKLLVALKQVCNHPAHYLRETASPAAERSEKLQLLDELVETIVASGSAVLVFTQYVQMARLLEKHLGDRGVPTQLLHGGVPAVRRDEMVQRFQAGEVPVFLLSLKAAGTGLNLTRADHVVHFDRWWNPAVEDQATDRAHRIGQTRTVQVHRLIARGTLEERIAGLLESKQELADAVLGGGGEAAFSDLSNSELRALVELKGA